MIHLIDENLPFELKNNMLLIASSGSSIILKKAIKHTQKKTNSKGRDSQEQHLPVWGGIMFSLKDSITESQRNTFLILETAVKFT